MDAYVPKQPLSSPVQGTLTSGYGYRDNPVNGQEDFHAGLDSAVADGTPVPVSYTHLIYPPGVEQGAVCRAAGTDARRFGMGRGHRIPCLLYTSSAWGKQKIIPPALQNSQPAEMH